MNFDDYRNVRALNWSTLKAMSDSPLHYKHYLNTPRTDTPALATGRAVHTAVLEPDFFDEEFVVRPDDVDLRTKAGKAWKASVEGRTVVPSSVLEIADAVHRHDQATAVLARTEPEYTVRWTHDGMDCKGRIDALADNRVVDLKTTSKPLCDFGVHAARYMYHGQLAYYLDGALTAGVCRPGASVYIVAVETAPPYDVGVFLMSAGEIAAGRALYTSLIDQLRSCMDSDMWPGRYPTLTPLSLPQWAEGMGIVADNEENDF